MDTVGPVLQDILTAAVTALKDCGRPTVKRKVLMPGSSVVWDDCCNGELWVRVTSLAPTVTNVTEVSDVTVNAGLGIVRCMHGLDGEGPPTAAQMTNDTLSMTADADALLQALYTFTPGPQTRPIVLGTGNPLGPQGLCGGFEWTFSFRQILCIGC